MGVVYATGEVSRIVPGRTLRAACKLARILAARVRVGVAIRVAKKWLPYGLTQNAGVGPRSRRPQERVGPSLRCSIRVPMAPRAALTLCHANPAIGVGTSPRLTTCT